MTDDERKELDLARAAWAAWAEAFGPLKPLTPEEAERALDEQKDAPPLSEERINEMVRYATSGGPEPPASYERYELPVPRYPWYFRWLLRLLQRRCKHYALKADILEGCGGCYAVRWCETCGSFWLTIDGTPCGMPRYPDPTLEPK